MRSAECFESYLKKLISLKHLFSIITALLISHVLSVIQLNEAQAQGLLIRHNIEMAETAFFEGYFQRSLNYTEELLDILRDNKTRLLLIAQGMHADDQEIYVRALQADALSAMGNHSRASGIINKAIRDVANIRLKYRKQGNSTGYAMMTLLRGYCELFAGDIEYARAKLTTYRITPSILSPEAQEIYRDLVYVSKPHLMMNKAHSWYEKSMYTIEEVSAIAQNENVDGVEGSNNDNQNSESDDEGGNNVQLTWSEILELNEDDLIQRLSTRCMVGLARAELHDALLTLKENADKERILRWLNSSSSDQSADAIGELVTLSDLINLMEAKLHAKVILDHDGFVDVNIQPEKVMLDFENTEGLTKLEAIEKVLKPHGLVGELRDGGFHIAHRQNLSTFRAITAAEEEKMDVSDVCAAADTHYQRAREVFINRRHYKFFIDPQREFAMSLKEVQANATKEQNEGGIAQQNMNALSAAYARTIMEWLQLDQDQTELTAIIPRSNETMEEAKKRQEKASERYTKLSDLVSESYDTTHPAYFAVKMSHSRFSAFMASAKSDILERVVAGEIQPPGGLTEEQLAFQVKIFHTQGIQEVEDLLKEMETSDLSKTHPLYLEGACVLLECIGQDTAEENQESIDFVEKLLFSIAEAHKS